MRSRDNNREVPAGARMRDDQGLNAWRERDVGERAWWDSATEEMWE